MMKLAAVLAILGSPALGWTACEDLWFSRNQVFDRAGYCFASPLGQAVFDNSNCTGSEVELDAATWDFVDYVKAMEALYECAVDTTATTLDIPNKGLRMKLEQVVALSEYASGCLGWTGEALPLRAGPRAGAEVLSVAMPGDDVTWEYEPIDWPDGWSFATIYRDGVQTALGWLQDPFDHDLCTGYAG
jgi:hypothetical protein